MPLKSATADLRRRIREELSPELASESGSFGEKQRRLVAVLCSVRGARPPKGEECPRRSRPAGEWRDKAWRNAGHVPSMFWKWRHASVFRLEAQEFFIAEPDLVVQTIRQLGPLKFALTKAMRAVVVYFTNSVYNFWSTEGRIWSSKATDAHSR